MEESQKPKARVISENRAEYLLGLADGSQLRVNKKLTDRRFYVGDYVNYQLDQQELVSIDLIPRRNTISKAANSTVKDYHFSEKDQVLATNIDQIFVLIPLDKNFSLARLERFVLVFSQETADLVIVLSKKDLYPNLQELLDSITSLYPQVRVMALSLYDETSIQAFKDLLPEGKTGLFIGASGVGKSSLLNRLQPNYQAKVNAVRSDDKGKHTTTSSSLVYCPDLNYTIVDTPGFKGIDTHHAIDSKVLFEEIELLSAQCRFSDCQHLTEPKCAVKGAVQEGRLDKTILERYHYNLNKLDLLSKRRKSWRL